MSLVVKKQFSFTELNSSVLQSSNDKRVPIVSWSFTDRNFTETCIVLLSEIHQTRVDVRNEQNKNHKQTENGFLYEWEFLLLSTNHNHDNNARSRFRVSSPARLSASVLEGLTGVVFVNTRTVLVQVNLENRLALFTIPPQKNKNGETTLEWIRQEKWIELPLTDSPPTSKNQNKDVVLSIHKIENNHPNSVSLVYLGYHPHENSQTYDFRVATIDITMRGKGEVDRQVRKECQSIRNVSLFPDSFLEMLHNNHNENESGGCITPMDLLWLPRDPNSFLVLLPKMISKQKMKKMRIHAIDNDTIDITVKVASVNNNNNSTELFGEESDPEEDSMNNNNTNKLEDEITNFLHQNETDETIFSLQLNNIKNNKTINRKVPSVMELKFDNNYNNNNNTVCVYADWALVEEWQKECIKKTESHFLNRIPKDDSFLTVKTIKKEENKILLDQTSLFCHCILQTNPNHNDSVNLIYYFTHIDESILHTIQNFGKFNENKECFVEYLAVEYDKEMNSNHNNDKWECAMRYMETLWAHCIEKNSGLENILFIFENNLSQFLNYNNSNKTLTETLMSFCDEMKSKFDEKSIQLINLFCKDVKNSFQSFLIELNYNNHHNNKSSLYYFVLCLLGGMYTNNDNNNKSAKIKQLLLQTAFVWTYHNNNTIKDYANIQKALFFYVHTTHNSNHHNSPLEVLVEDIFTIHENNNNNNSFERSMLHLALLQNSNVEEMEETITTLLSNHHHHFSVLISLVDVHALLCRWNVLKIVNCEGCTPLLFLLCLLDILFCYTQNKNNINHNLVEDKLKEWLSPSIEFILQSEFADDESSEEETENNKRLSVLLQQNGIKVESILTQKCFPSFWINGVSIFQIKNSILWSSYTEQNSTFIFQIWHKIGLFFEHYIQPDNNNNTSKFALLREGAEVILYLCNENNNRMGEELLASWDLIQQQQKMENKETNWITISNFSELRSVKRDTWRSEDPFFSNFSENNNENNNLSVLSFIIHRCWAVQDGVALQNILTRELNDTNNNNHDLFRSIWESVWSGSTATNMCLLRKVVETMYTLLLTGQQHTNNNNNNTMDKVLEFVLLLIRPLLTHTYPRLLVTLRTAPLRMTSALVLPQYNTLQADEKNTKQISIGECCDELRYLILKLMTLLLSNTENNNHHQNNNNHNLLKLKCMKELFALLPTPATLIESTEENESSPNNNNNNNKAHLLKLLACQLYPNMGYQNHYIYTSVNDDSEEDSSSSSGSNNNNDANTAPFSLSCTSLLFLSTLLPIVQEEEKRYRLLFMSEVLKREMKLFVVGKAILDNILVEKEEEENMPDNENSNPVQLFLSSLKINEKRFTPSVVKSFINDQDNNIDGVVTILANYVNVNPHQANYYPNFDKICRLWLLDIVQEIFLSFPENNNDNTQKIVQLVKKSASTIHQKEIQLKEEGDIVSLTVRPLFYKEYCGGREVETEEKEQDQKTAVLYVQSDMHVKAQQQLKQAEEALLHPPNTGTVIPCDLLSQASLVSVRQAVKEACATEHAPSFEGLCCYASAESLEKVNPLVASAQTWREQQQQRVRQAQLRQTQEREAEEREVQETMTSMAKGGITGTLFQAFGSTIAPPPTTAKKAAPPTHTAREEITSGNTEVLVKEETFRRRSLERQLLEEHRTLLLDTPPLQTALLELYYALRLERYKKDLQWFALEQKDIIFTFQSMIEVTNRKEVRLALRQLAVDASERERELYEHITTMEEVAREELEVCCATERATLLRMHYQQEELWEEEERAVRDLCHSENGEWKKLMKQAEKVHYKQQHTLVGEDDEEEEEEEVSVSASTSPGSTRRGSLHIAEGHPSENAHPHHLASQTKDSLLKFADRLVNPAPSAEPNKGGGGFMNFFNKIHDTVIDTVAPAPVKKKPNPSEPAAPPPAELVSVSLPDVDDEGWGWEEEPEDKAVKPSAAPVADDWGWEEETEVKPSAPPAVNPDKEDNWGWEEDKEEINDTKQNDQAVSAPPETNDWGWEEEEETIAAPSQENKDDVPQQVAAPPTGENDNWGWEEEPAVAPPQESQDSIPQREDTPPQEIDSAPMSGAHQDAEEDWGWEEEKQEAITVDPPVTEDWGWEEEKETKLPTPPETHTEVKNEDEDNWGWEEEPAVAPTQEVAPTAAAHQDAEEEDWGWEEEKQETGEQEANPDPPPVAVDHSAVVEAPPPTGTDDWGWGDEETTVAPPQESQDSIPQKEDTPPQEIDSAPMSGAHQDAEEEWGWGDEKQEAAPSPTVVDHDATEEVPQPPVTDDWGWEEKETLPAPPQESQDPIPQKEEIPPQEVAPAAPAPVADTHQDAEENWGWEEEKQEAITVDPPPTVVDQSVTKEALPPPVTEDWGWEEEKETKLPTPPEIPTEVKNEDEDNWGWEEEESNGTVAVPPQETAPTVVSPAPNANPDKDDDWGWEEEKQDTTSPVKDDWGWEDDDKQAAPVVCRPPRAVSLPSPPPAMTPARSILDAFAGVVELEESVSRALLGEEVNARATLQREYLNGYYSMVEQFLFAI